MIKIANIIGARPQFIKYFPISKAIGKVAFDSGVTINEVLIHSGQHYDYNMSKLFFDELGIRDPDYHLGVGSGLHGRQTGLILQKIEPVLAKERPDIVMVFGDTNSTLAAALGAAKLHIPVAHIEAGLRSFNRRMPEEINRVLTDQVSTFLFCPTKKAVENLKKEGIPSESLSTSPISPHVYLVGDVMFDVFLRLCKQSSQKSNILQKLSYELSIENGFVLCTLHRAENTDDPKSLSAIFSALDQIAHETPIILPMHPRTKKSVQAFHPRFSSPPSRLKIISPLGYLDILDLLSNCSLVMTDSGGLQKEAFFSGKPCVTLRDETEWVELVEYGFNKVVGSDSERIYEGYILMRDKKIDTELKLYGDGKASKKIISCLLNHMK